MKYIHAYLLYLLIHKVLTGPSIAARAGGTLIDVFLTVKARKSHFTITPGEEKTKSLILTFCLRWDLEDLCFLQAHAQSKKKKNLSKFPFINYTSYLL